MPWRFVSEAANMDMQVSEGACCYAEAVASPSLPAQMASPVPGAMTPASDSDGQEAPMLLAVDCCETSVVLGRRRSRGKEIGDCLSASKRPRTRPRSPSPWTEVADSQASTAAPPLPTMPTTPSAISSPTLSPACDPELSLPRLAPMDYAQLSEDELRAELGLQGSGIAEDWNQAELANLMEELDRICMPLLSSPSP
mmetsp:Transcript_101596/g.270182  ORF Transcript_101596/g.270182 Transcript_101596/m.270182 type:complete len:197 (-) Transcript_101596:117-707(-)